MEITSGRLGQTLVKGPRRSRTGQRILGFCGTIAVALGGFLYWRDLPPEIHVPTPAMPSPNALDYFIRAANLEKDSTKVDWAIASVHTGAVRDDRLYSTAEKAALIRENAPALLEFRKGLTYPYQQPPMRSFSARLPYYAKTRALARLLMLEAQVKGEQGDWGGAASTDLDNIRMGAAVPRGGTLIAGLVGIAITAIGEKQLWKDADHLNATQARSAIRSLNSITFVPYSQVMQEEEWGTEAGLAESMRSPHWRGACEEFSSDNASEALLFWLRLQPYSKRQIMDNYTRYMDSLVANARLPYVASSAEPPIPNDPINNVLAPFFSSAGFRAVRMDTQTDQLTTALALRAYFLEHHQYPAHLQELVPSYLPSLTADPFAHSGPLSYRVNGSSYLLYSVGPDGKDDGGIPCKPAQGTHMNSYDATSKGDIVVGVNTP